SRPDRGLPDEPPPSLLTLHLKPRPPPSQPPTGGSAGDRSSTPSPQAQSGRPPLVHPLPMFPASGRLAALIAAQDYVITREQALALGMTRHGIENCFEYDGWQHLLPSVYLTHVGNP